MLPSAHTSPLWISARKSCTVVYHRAKEKNPAGTGCPRSLKQDETGESLLQSKDRQIAGEQFQSGKE